MRPDHWRAVTAFADAQYGLVSHEQLTNIGVPVRTVRDAVSTGALVVQRRGVLVVAGSGPSIHRPLLAACLAGGGDTVASHLGAAWLGGFPPVEPGTVEVTRLIGRRARLDGVRTHQTNRLLADDRTVLAGIPVTSPARTAIDLGSCLSERLLIRFVDHATRNLGLDIDTLATSLAFLGGRGRPGTRTLRRAIAERREGLRPGDSDLEVRVLRELVLLGVPRPEQNVVVEAGGRVFVLDLVWLAIKVAVEVDGFAYHSSRSSFDHDRQRDLLLKRDGWEILRVSSNSDLALVADVLLRRLQCAVAGGSPHSTAQ